jgi:glycosyltransferase 2 family protein
MSTSLFKDAPDTNAAQSAAAVTGFAGWVGAVWKKLIDFTRKTLSNFGLWTRHPGALGLSFLFTCLHMLCLFTSIWMLLDGMGQSISWIQVAGIWSLVYFITLMPVSVNGYGLQEISTTLLYVRLGGLSTEASVTIALLVRTLQMVTSLPGAFFVGGILAARQEKKPDVLPEA